MHIDIINQVSDTGQHLAVAAPAMVSAAGGLVGTATALVKSLITLGYVMVGGIALLAFIVISWKGNWKIPGVLGGLFTAALIGWGGISGIGWLSNQVGATADSVTASQVISHDGEGDFGPLTQA